MVLHDQDQRRVLGADGRRLRRGRGRLTRARVRRDLGGQQVRRPTRQREPEPGPAARARGVADRSAAQLGQLAREGQPDARALVRPVVVACHLKQAVEHSLARVLGDAGAGVLDLDADDRLVLDQPHRGSAPRGRELQRVVDEVAEDLVEDVRIEPDHPDGRRRQGQGHAPLGREALEAGDRPGDLRPQLHPARAQDDLAGLEPGDVHELPHQLLHPCGVPQHALVDDALLGPGRAAHPLDARHHQSQRRPQLVVQVDDRAGAHALELGDPGRLLRQLGAADQQRVRLGLDLGRALRDLGLERSLPPPQRSRAHPRRRERQHHHHHRPEQPRRRSLAPPGPAHPRERRARPPAARESGLDLEADRPRGQLRQRHLALAARRRPRRVAEARAEHDLLPVLRHRRGPPQVQRLVRPQLHGRPGLELHARRLGKAKPPRHGADDPVLGGEPEGARAVAGHRPAHRSVRLGARHAGLDAELQQPGRRTAAGERRELLAATDPQAHVARQPDPSQLVDLARVHATDHAARTEAAPRDLRRRRGHRTDRAQPLFLGAHPQRVPVPSHVAHVVDQQLVVAADRAQLVGPVHDPEPLPPGADRQRVVVERREGPHRPELRASRQRRQRLARERVQPVVAAEHAGPVGQAGLRARVADARLALRLEARRVVGEADDPLAPLAEEPHAARRQLGGEVQGLRAQHQAVRAGAAVLGVEHDPAQAPVQRPQAVGVVDPHAIDRSFGPARPAVDRQVTQRGGTDPQQAVRARRHPEVSVRIDGGLARRGGQAPHLAPRVGDGVPGDPPGTGRIVAGRAGGRRGVRVKARAEHLVALLGRREAVAVPGAKPGHQLNDRRAVGSAPQSDRAGVDARGRAEAPGLSARADQEHGAILGGEQQRPVRRHRRAGARPPVLGPRQRHGRVLEDEHARAGPQPDPLTIHRPFDRGPAELARIPEAQRTVGEAGEPTRLGDHPQRSVVRVGGHAGDPSGPERRGPGLVHRRELDAVEADQPLERGDPDEAIPRERDAGRVRERQPVVRGPLIDHEPVTTEHRAGGGRGGRHHGDEQREPTGEHGERHCRRGRPPRVDLEARAPACHALCRASPPLCRPAIFAGLAGADTAIGDPRHRPARVAVLAMRCDEPPARPLADAKKHA